MNLIDTAEFSALASFRGDAPADSLLSASSASTSLAPENEASKTNLDVYLDEALKILKSRYAVAELDTKKPARLEPACIMQRIKKGMECTTVKWNDGTYTTVKISCEDHTEHTPYVAFCAALAKKMYGTNSAVHRMVDRHLETHLREKQEELRAQMIADREARMNAEHEKKLLKEAARLRLKEEAKRYNAAHSYNDQDVPEKG